MALKEWEKEARGKVQVCRCPKCGRNHRNRLHWIGRGTPRMFCDYCKKVMEQSEWDVWLDDEFAEVTGRARCISGLNLTKNYAAPNAMSQWTPT
jgi:hypothetical protein